jgi:hypothetical protein
MRTTLTTVIASEAKQSIGTAGVVAMDCFVASLLAMTRPDNNIQTEDTP